MKAKYSIIVPCYNEQETVGLFYEAVIPVMESLNEPFEIIFVNDGSRDNTLKAMNDLAQADKRVKAINFSRNFGQQAAIFCGFEYAEGDAVICMDVDLQDPVEAVPKMIEKWKEGYEVVHGRRVKREGESFFKKITSSMFLKFIRKISGMDIPKNVGEFKLLDRKVVDTLNEIPEQNRYLRGLVSWVGYSQTYVDFVRNERIAGQTKYSVKKLFKLAGSSIISYSTWPLNLAMHVGLWLGFLSLTAFVTFTVLVLCNIALPLVAWVFPSVAIGFAATFVLFGINNIYFKRLYQEAQNRPHYIVSQTYNIEK